MSGPIVNLGLPPKPAATAPVQVVVPQMGGVGGAIAAPPKRTFLDRLKANTIGPESKSAPPIILVRGNRGVKTVSAFAIPLDDEAHLKKCPGLPIPPGSRVYGITFDNQTEGSLKDHFAGTKVLEKRPIEVLHVARDAGFDPGIGRTALDTEDAFKEFLRDMAANRVKWNIGLLVIDRCDIYTESVLKSVCFALSGTPIGGQMEANKWTPRAMKIEEMLALLPQAVLDGGYVVVTGTNQVNEGQEKLVNINGKWMQGRLQSKWASRIAHGTSVEIDVEKAKVQGREEEVRHAVVTETRLREQFPAGARVILDGRNISAFLDPANHLDSVREVLRIAGGE